MVVSGSSCIFALHTYSQSEGGSSSCSSHWIPLQTEVISAAHVHNLSYHPHPAEGTHQAGQVSDVVAVQVA